MYHYETSNQTLLGEHVGKPVPRRGKKIEDGESRIIEAAIACFRRFGPLKTSMSDIADAAKVGRQTVYRTFRSREDLLEAVAIRRLRAMADRIRPLVIACGSLEAALIGGSIETLRLARQDKIFMSLFETAGDRGVERYLLQSWSPVQEPMLSIWRDVFAKARKRGELRKDLADKEVAEWLRAVHFILLLREDLDEAGQKALLKTFVVPSLTA
jgi:AcrR family transcriptional regulator